MILYDFATGAGVMKGRKNPNNQPNTKKTKAKTIHHTEESTEEKWLCKFAARKGDCKA